jgi:hypothetical protein
MTPATLNLTLTRGITFGPILFLFSSKILGVVVASPGQDNFTCPAHGLSVDAAVRFRVTNGVLPDPIDAQTIYYVIASGLTPDNFKVSITQGGSAVDIRNSGSGTQEVIAPADMTDWIPYAEVRTEPESTLVLDLEPELVYPQYGVVRIPAIQDEQTILLPAGNGGKLKCKWDLIFQVPTGERIGPYIAGSFLIKSIITEPAEP